MKKQNENKNKHLAGRQSVIDSGVGRDAD